MNFSGNNFSEDSDSFLGDFLEIISQCTFEKTLEILDFSACFLTENSILKLSEFIKS